MENEKTIKVKMPEGEYDKTYYANPDNIPLEVTEPAEPVDSITMPDGSIITGTGLTKTPPPKTITLADLKAQAAALEQKITEAGRVINEDVPTWQSELDAVIADLEKYQPIVDEALIGWKPDSVETVEPTTEIPAEQITP